MGLRWPDAPAAYGPHKTFYNRSIRWSRLAVSNRIFAELAAQGGKADRLKIDATHFKAHLGRVLLQAPRGLRPPGQPARHAA